MADVAARLLTSPTAAGAVQLRADRPGVPQLRDVASRISAVFARQVRYCASLPDEQAREELLGSRPGALGGRGDAGAVRWIRAGGAGTLTSDVRDVTGRDPRPAQDWLAEFRAVFLDPLSSTPPLNGPHLAGPTGTPRARALGIPFDGTPGRWNAITDVAGVEVGYRTIIAGGSVRTGVTAICPRGRAGAGPGRGRSPRQNGNGELTGAPWIEETGRSTCRSPSPTLIRSASRTTRPSAGVATRSSKADEWSLPVAGETYDGWLNDINGFHVTVADVFAALDGASGGAIEEGSVGGGTGMICYGFKGGSGTASRQVPSRPDLHARRLRAGQLRRPRAP